MPRKKASPPPPPPKNRRKAAATKSKNKPRSGLLGLMFNLWALGLLAFAAMAMLVAFESPDRKITDNLDRAPGIQYLDRNGIRFAGSGSVYGDPITVKSVPSYVIAAILATEDRHFFEHGGIDFIGIARAMVANLASGSVVQGGSTISQQLAKNLFLSHERTLIRKLREVGLALWLERNYSKEEILAMYLNRVFFGSNTWGIDGAAHTYFGKSATELNLPEAAMLVGLLKAPSRLNPHANPEKAAARARQVLANMVDAGVLDFADSKEAGLALDSIARKTPRLSGSRFFADWVANEVGQIVGSLEQDLVVETTIDARWQNLSGQILKGAIDENGTAHNLSQGALLSMADTGAIMAMNGGYQYAYSQFNRATQALRQPGSTFKIFVALAALRNGYTPETLVQDTAFTDRRWKPRNFDDQYKGTISLEQAFVQSRNVPMVRIARDVGMGQVIQAARDMGITASIRNDLSSALGTSEMSMLQMVRAYAVVSNGGQVVKPFGVLRIRNRDGSLLYEHPRERTAYTLNADEVSGLHYLLSRVLTRWDGTGRKARVTIVSGGKTGTSQNSRDAWFIGYAGGVTTGIWLGNDDNTSMVSMTGGSLPAAMWHEYVTQALRL